MRYSVCLSVYLAIETWKDFLSVPVSIYVCLCFCLSFSSVQWESMNTEQAVRERFSLTLFA